ncbi:hypothetical protein [Flavobacterium sp.]|uniref:hypothetical protein n=1 Tax=Flavobacterium sp. TaxID=239 RepID=UPI0028BF1CDF|nr:hypothetical protein [Flavobacterium sp.]
MKTKLPLLLLAIFLCHNQILYSQVGIGTIVPDAALDVTSTDNGLLIPRVALIANNSATPLTTPTVSELIYNTATVGGVNGVIPGYYYWNGTLWIQLSTGTNNDWSITGNSGTTAGTNFIGTTDARDLRFKTGGADRLNISNTNGQFQSYYLGTAAVPSFSWSSDPNTGIFSPAGDVQGFSTNGNERMRILNGGVVIGNTVAFAGDRFSSYGLNNEYCINAYAIGSGGAAIYGDGDTSYGYIGFTNSANRSAYYGSNLHANGTGIVVSGNNIGTSFLAAGSGGAFTGSITGSASFATNNGSGWGVVGAGNNLGVTTIAGGGGGAFSGNQWGVYGNATITGMANAGTNRAAFVGTFNETSTPRTVYLGARIGGVNYKVFGTGSASVSTTMPTRDGERILFAPEAPENWFFDIGEVTLVNGKATVTLDPVFQDCISDSKPFKVFVQGGENTIGAIRITRNQKEKTFIVEDMGGASNGIVQYSIYGIWKQKENLRFPKYEQPFEVKELKTETVSITKKKSN